MPQAEMIEVRMDREIELKFADSGEPGTFSGYGSFFGNVDSHGDVVAKGAFKDTLATWGKKGKLPKMLMQHGGGFFGSADDAVPVGKWTNMKEDAKGLYCEGRLFGLDTDSGKRRYEAMREGELDGLSIGFRARREDVDYANGDGEPVRTIKKLDLFEVSIVTFGSNPLALIDSVKAAGRIKTVREFEDFLRDVGGFSHAAAKAIAAGGFKAKPDPRDEDGLGEAIAGPFARLAELIRK